MPKTPRKQASFSKVAECLYRNQSSGTYYALVKRSGSQIRRSLKTKERKLAERRLKDFRDQADRLSSNGKDKRLSFRSLAQRWEPIATANLKPSSADRVRRCMRMLDQFFGDQSITGITSRDCEEWATQRGRNIAASTFNQDAQVLKGIMEYAVGSGLLLDNPASVIKRRRVVDKAILIPSHEQFCKLIESLHELDARAREAVPLVKLLALSGMRLGEATRITWGEVDFGRNQFTVSGGEVGTKNREVRIVPLFPSLLDLLKELSDGQETERDSCIITIRSARKAMETACRIAKLPHFTHHCLRHYFVSNAIEKSIDFKTIAAWIGHKDGGLLVAKTYGHLRDTHSFEMAKRMT